MSSSETCRKLISSGQSREDRRSRVLCIGYDQTLLKERARTLRRGGFQVTVASTTEDIYKRINKRPFDAIVIGHRVPEETRKQILQEARHRSPRATVVLLYRGRIQNAACADAVISVDSGPKFLASSLQSLLPEHGSD